MYIFQSKEVLDVHEVSMFVGSLLVIIKYMYPIIYLVIYTIYVFIYTHNNIHML